MVALKEDAFDYLLSQYSTNTQDILKSLDDRLRGMGAVQRYTTDVPDIRYRLEVESGFKPVFARVRPGRNEVLVEIEPVLDPLHRTRPREKTVKWRPKSPRSDTELPLTRTPDWYDTLLLANSMLRSMTGRIQSK